MRIPSWKLMAIEALLTLAMTGCVGAAGIYEQFGCLSLSYGMLAIAAALLLGMAALLWPARRRVWTRVDACGRVWTHVDACGRVWTRVDARRRP